MVDKNSKDIFKREETLQTFSSMEAIKVFLTSLRLMLSFLRDCVKNVPFYSRFVGLKENF